MNTYSPRHFSQMLADPVRVPAYAKALAEIITPETIVLDLGAGTGGFTLLACSLGAKKVIAVEPNPAIQIARELVKENKFEDRVEFYEEKIENLNFSQVDLIIADLRGKLPFYEDNLKIMKLAQEKFLKPTGKLLPSIDKIYLAPCRDKNIFNQKVRPFLNQKFPFTTKAYEKYLCNTFYPLPIKQEMLSAKPSLWCQLDYTKIQDYSHRSTVSFTGSNETLFGFFAWFDCELTSTVSYSCGPDAKNQVYGSVFFPFENGIDVNVSQKLVIELSAKHMEKDYIWRWKTSIHDTATNSKKILFDQSTFYGSAFSAYALNQTIE